MTKRAQRIADFALKYATLPDARRLVSEPAQTNQPRVTTPPAYRPVPELVPIYMLNEQMYIREFGY
ncbi:MAG: hypothetical protein ACLQFI_05040 [Methylocella sp.]|jgi:hypothetical protein